MDDATTARLRGLRAAWEMKTKIEVSPELWAWRWLLEEFASRVVDELESLHRRIDALEREP